MDIAQARWCCTSPALPSGLVYASPGSRNAMSAVCNISVFPSFLTSLKNVSNLSSTTARPTLPAPHRPYQFDEYGGAKLSSNIPRGRRHHCATVTCAHVHQHASALAPTCSRASAHKEMHVNNPSPFSTAFFSLGCGVKDFLCVTLGRVNVRDGFVPPPYSAFLDRKFFALKPLELVFDVILPSFRPNSLGGLADLAVRAIEHARPGSIRLPSARVK